MTSCYRSCDKYIIGSFERRKYPDTPDNPVHHSGCVVGIIKQAAMPNGVVEFPEEPEEPLGT